jgi:hypothetical protein
METEQVCEMCHSNAATPITLHYAKAGPSEKTITLPDGKTHQVTETGQQEVLLCDKCSKKVKRSSLLKASGGCLGRFLLGTLMCGALLWVLVRLIPNATAIVSLVSGLLALGILSYAVSPVGEALRAKKNDNVITHKKAELQKQGFNLFWTV